MEREKLLKEIDEQTKKLNELQSELSDQKEKDLKEKYGDDFKCSNCRYDAFENVGEGHTYCLMGKCVLCEEYCDYFKIHTEVSKWIEKQGDNFDIDLFNIKKLLYLDFMVDVPEKFLPDLRVAIRTLSIIYKKTGEENE